MASEIYRALEAPLLLASAYAFSPIQAGETFLPNVWPFARGSRFDPVNDIPKLTDKVFFVTGGNTGIGKETILQLAFHKPKHIYLGARTESKALEAIASIKSECKRREVIVSITWVPLDLQSFPSIARAAEQINQESDRLDILILNAGIMATPAGHRTEAGHDDQMGTNYIGHFLLTKLLLPKLQQTAELRNSDVRVVTVSSEAHWMAPDIGTITSTDSLTQTSPWVRYGASKASNVMFAAELARRCPNLTSVSVHPGLIRTDLYDASASSNILLKLGLRIGSFAFMSVPEGALTQLYVAAGTPKDKLENGQYYVPYGKVRPNKWAENVEYGQKLWEWTESELNNAGY